MGQIKSRKRVQDFGEVYTNPREVNAMCDLIPEDVWDNIDSTFLEPACGNGNFLVEIVRRKLNRCRTPQEALRAVSSVYGIDILPDNVDESRERVKALVSDMFPGVDLSVVDRNIICGDSLEIMKKWEED